MSNIFDILSQLRATTSSNDKLKILKENKDDPILPRLLKMTYDTVAFNYYISPKTLDLRSVGINHPRFPCNLPYVLDQLEHNLCNRTYTGNAARTFMVDLMRRCDNNMRILIVQILDRDLKLNLGRTQINKVFPNLCVKIPYMRCSIYSEKTAKKISYPAISQVKADGTLRYAVVSSGNVSFVSRSGEEYEYPILEKIYSTLPDGVYVGELLVEGITNRAEANGLINSDEPPHDKIYHSTWDFIQLDEYSAGQGTIKYKDRFESLKQNLKSVEDDKIQIIESHEVNNLEEAVAHTVRWMNMGLEGSILKDYGNTFKNHTSPTMLKLKVEAECEVICTGFIEGTKGTKREATFGSITFESADGLVKGSTSGFTDAQLEDFNSRRDELIGKVFTVRFNDMTRARDSDTWALSHPRFLEFREKDEADTFEHIRESLNSAKLFKEGK